MSKESASNDPFKLLEARSKEIAQNGFGDLKAIEEDLAKAREANHQEFKDFGVVSEELMRTVLK